ncbi:hypothetical protein SNE40_003056 [Patella caerulea]|uniref:Calcineurin-binding protein cabin-1 n=1 Tax=Patella caerulea TaxID=87958 RepID=A0AAN8KDF0_PATCE
MIRISALNESDSDGSQDIVEATTKEAKEAEAFAWYNRALVLQKQGNILDAELTFQQIIDHPFLQEASDLVENEVEGAIHPGLPLLYSVHKNLAGISAARNDEKTALHHYLEAVKVDESEVTVWYKIGKIALNVHNYSLAKFAFEQGLECNPNHWPCLDQVITITYAYLNFWNCLIYIARALEKDCFYMKAITIRDQIYKESPDLESLSKRLFIYCDPVTFRTKVDKEEYDEYIKEAVDIRSKRRELAKPPPPSVIKLPEKIDKFTWKRVGECFLSLCKMANDPKEPLSMCRPVDMSEYVNVMEQPMEMEELTKNEIMMEVQDDEIKTQEDETKTQDDKIITQNDKIITQDDKIEVEDENIKTEDDKIKDIKTAIDEVQVQNAEILQEKETSVSKTNDLKTAEVSSIKESNDVTLAESVKNEDIVPNIPAEDTGANVSDTTSKCDTEATTESSQESDIEMIEVTSQSSCESEITVNPESEVSQKSADSVTASISNNQLSFPATALSASEVLLKVAARVSASSSIKDTEPALSIAEVSSTTDVPQEDNQPSDLSDCIVIEASTDNQTTSGDAKTADTESKQVNSVSSSIVQNQTGEKGKQRLLASMIVGDFIPADEDIDFETLFKDHTFAKSGTDTPTFRSDPSRGQKRKRLHLDDRYGNKRRSARVKNTKDQKQEDSVNFQELLQKFLPSSLIQIDEDDEEEMKNEDTEQEKDKTSEENTKDNVKKEVTELLSDNEDTEVRKFIHSCIKNFGIAHLCRKYLSALAEQDFKKWPKGLSGTFLELFRCIRSNMTFPDLFSYDVKEETKILFSKIGLVACELILDEYITQHGTSNSIKNDDLEKNFNIFYKEDLWYILFVMGCPGILKHNGISYAVRVYWLRGRYSLLQVNIEDAVMCFEQAIFYLKEMEEKEQKSSVKLENCQTDQLISVDKVSNRRDNVQRTQSMDQTKKMFENEDYSKVIDSLTKLFEDSQHKTPQSCVSPPERHNQMKLLQKALFKHGDMQKCVLWGEVLLNESLYYYRKAPTPVQREEWNKTMTEVLSTLHKVFEKDNSACKKLPSKNKIRFSQNLMKIIEIMMDVSVNVVDMPIGTVVPWNLLYRIIHFEEVKLHNMIASQSEGQADILDGAISSSLMLLSVAHEYLGRHSWCTKNNGAVLLLFLKILKKERKKSKLSANLKEDLDIAFEQCVYCLYGHPNKKIKSRRLQDHNSPPISLTWIRAQNVFEYFKPSAVPEFDSYKASTVSAELEGLLRRVFVLVPEDIGAASRIDTVLKYIDGEINTPPSYETDNPVLKELYYLLADYYFKNKETSKATRFYQYDLCVNPLRLDSWAGTALARMSQLEQKLNAMELKLDTPVHKKAIAALRCFKRAVEINDSIRTLWIEYGSLAYQLHSHASRQLKMQKWFPLEDELLDIVKASKCEMLQTSHNCYWKASECEADGNEEEWLHHYMMGKVKEKKGAHPKDYLEHYRQAAIYLHEDEAVYPKRIVFSNSPPHLAIEALEVYYRLHAAILKNLLRQDGVHDYPLYDHYVTEAAASPFAKGREKRQERRESTNEDSCSSNSAYSQSKQKLVYHMTPQDHTYSKKKSTSSSDSDNNYSSVNESSTDSKMEINASMKPGLQKQITEPFVPTIDKSCVTSVETDDKIEVKGNVEVMDTSETKEESTVNRDSTIGGVVGMEIDINVNASASEAKNSVTDDTASDGKTSVGDNKMNFDITSDKSITGNKIIDDSNVETKTSATDTKTSATDTKTPASDTKTSAADTKTSAADTKTSASDTKTSSTDTKTSSTDTKACTTDTKTTSTDTKTTSTDTTSTDTKTTDTKTNSIDTKTSSTDTKTSDTETKTSATDTKTSATDTKTCDIDRSASSSSITSEVNLSTVDNKSGASEDKLNESNHDKHDEDPSNNTSFIDLTASDDEPMQETDPVIENKPDDLSTKENTPKSVVAAQHDVTDKTGSISDTETPIIIDSSDVSDVDIDKCILEKSEKNKIQPETKKVQPKKPEEKPQSVLSDDPETVHKQLIEKCMASLHLCLSRFPNHYKSLYRLAHVYASSKYKKNLQYAKDILLGNAHWQSLSHMETPGLFHERKTANFFQGIWKIPVQEIDRAGSFAAHMNRSIYLLLDILKQLQDNRMLYNIHVQLLRVPDTGRKFVRDAERTYLWKLAFRYTVEVMMIRSEQLLKETVEEKRLAFLMDVYKVWHHGIHKLNKFVESTNKVFIKTFRLALQDKVDKNSSNSSILEQATRFCQHRQSQLSARLPQIPSQKPSHLSKSQDSQSDSSLFSPTKSDSQSIFFSPPSKKSLSQGVSMSPVPYSPDTPHASVPGTKISSSSPSTPKSSMVSSSLLSSPSTPKSSRLISNKLSSTTSNVASPVVETKKTNRLPVTPATPDIVMSSSTKPPVKQVSNSTPSTSPKIIQTTPKAVPKEILSAPKGSPKIVQTTPKVIPKEIQTAPKVSSHVTSHKQPSSTVQATISNINVPKKLVPQITKINSPKQMSPTFPKNLQVVKKSNLSNPHVKSTLSKGTPAIAKKATVAHTSQSKPKPPQSASSSDNQVVETLIESHEEDELLILSNPDQLTLDIQSFLAHHNL